MNGQLADPCAFEVLVFQGKHVCLSMSTGSTWDTVSSEALALIPSRHWAYKGPHGHLFPDEKLKNCDTLLWEKQDRADVGFSGDSWHTAPSQVTLMLLDQNNREHVIDAFRPDVTSSSFQRPVSDMNIASGCPLFCPVSKMEAKGSYVRDDAIFIKAIVDLTGL